MKRITFQTNDPELLDFLQSLGHKRSVVLCALLRDCLEKNEGYLPARIMAETGFTYKKPTRSTPVRKKSVSYAKPKTARHEQAQTVKKNVSQDVVPAITPEVIPSQPVIETPTQVPVPPEVTPVQAPTITPEPMPSDMRQDSSGDDDNYVSKTGPVITNPETVLKGLSSFGIF